MNPQRHLGLILKIFLTLCFFDCLGAYGIAGIPFPWMAASGFTLLAIAIGMRSRLLLFPGYIFAILLTIWAVIITYGNDILFGYSDLAPSTLGIPFDAFIFLRVLAIVAFIATVAVGFWLINNGQGEGLILGIVGLGLLTAVFSIYVYFAQLNGWWEPPRNLPGTNGNDPVTHFTYFFHRAMGTFKEPSHNAEWFVLPFFLSFTITRRWIWPVRLLIGISLLLTGSLTGFAAILAGSLLAWLTCGPLRQTNLAGLTKVLTFTFATAVVAGLLAFSYSQHDVSLLGLLSNRLSDLLTVGFSQTDRAYIASYVDTHQFPIFGVGLGNSNLLLMQALGYGMVTAFLSLYINYIYSLGLPGLALVLLLVGTPIWRLVRMKVWRNPNPETFFVLAAYWAWLVMYTMHSEQFSPIFGVAYALVCRQLFLNPIRRTRDGAASDNLLVNTNDLRRF